MGQEDVPQRQQGEDDKAVAAEVRRLAARVDALERELGALRASSASRVDVSPRPAPPPPVSPPEAPLLAVVVESNRVAVPPAPPPAPSMPPLAPRPSPSLENRLGAQVFNRIGIVAVLFGAALFLKLAIDNHWIGPV